MQLALHTHGWQQRPAANNKHPAAVQLPRATWQLAHTPSGRISQSLHGRAVLKKRLTPPPPPSAPRPGSGPGLPVPLQELSRLAAPGLPRLAGAPTSSSAGHGGGQRGRWVGAVSSIVHRHHWQRHSLSTCGIISLSAHPPGVFLPPEWSSSAICVITAMPPCTGPCRGRRGMQGGHGSGPKVCMGARPEQMLLLSLPASRQEPASASARWRGQPDPRTSPLAQRRPSLRRRRPAAAPGLRCGPHCTRCWTAGFRWWMAASG